MPNSLQSGEEKLTKLLQEFRFNVFTAQLDKFSQMLYVKDNGV